MRRRPQPHDLGAQRHAPVIPVVRDVIERDVNRHLIPALFIGKNRKRFFRYRATFPAAKSGVFAAFAVA